MDETSKVATEKSAPPPPKPLVMKFDIGVYITVLLLEAILGFAWFHSRISPIRTSWSDPTAGAAGRFSSVDGRLLWQRCVISDLQMSRSEKRLPFQIVVGSNPNGHTTPIQCGELEVAFAYPAEGHWFGFHNSVSAFANQSLKYRIEWREETLSYPAMMVAVLIVLVLCLIEPVVRMLKRYSRNA